MLKKIISLLLCTAILPTHAFAADGNDTENTGFSARVEKLAYLGITFDEGVGDAEEVTRAKFTRTLLEFTDTAPNGGDCGFYDIDADYPYSDEINTGAALGYMIGYADGKFYPERTISVNEAVKAFVNALGYEVLAKQSGDYPKGYISVAESIGLVDDIKIGERALKYDEFSILLENALECSVYKLSFKDGSPSYDNEEENDALWNFHRTVKVRAVVTANCVTALDEEAGKTSGAEYAKLDGETVYTGNSNVSEYLGYSVDAYVYFDKDDDMGEVKYAVPSAKNVTVKVKAENIMGDSPEFGAFNFVYENENGRAKNVRITDETNIIYNGVAKPDYKRENLVPEIGYVLLTDNDNDGDVECISIFKAEKIIVVDYAVSDDNGIRIVDEKDSSDNYLYDKDYEHYKVYVNGTDNIPSAITKGMVALVGENGEHSITYAFSSTVSGKITAMSKGEPGEHGKVSVDGTEYKMASGTENYPFKLGAEGTFFVDDDFYVYGFKKNGDEKKYGYFVRGYFDEDESPIIAAIKVLTEDNEYVRFDLDEHVKLNGTKKDAEDVMKFLYKSGTESWQPQVVMYKLDGDGKLTVLNTVTKDGDLRWEGRFYACQKTSVPTSEYTGTLENGTFLDAEKKVFFGYNHGYDFYADSWQNIWYQDSDTVFFNIYDDDPEQSYVSEPLNNISRQGFVHEFYNVDEDMNTVDVVVWKREGASTEELPKIANDVKPAIVKSATTVLDKDDLPVKALVVSQGGKTLEISWNEKAPQLVKDTFNSLHAGDIIYYELDGAGRISNMYRAFDITKKGQYGMSMTFGEVHGGTGTAVHLEKRSFYVKITRKLQNNFFRYTSINDASGDLQKMNTGAEIYKMTVKNGKVTVDTISYDDVQNGDEVFCKANTNTIWSMIVIDAK